MKKFDKPVRTDIEWNFIKDSSISILGETDKALLMVVSFLVRKGTSLVSEFKEREQWIPKSVWDNNKYFETYKYMGGEIEVKTFKPPYFLR